MNPVSKLPTKPGNCRHTLVRCLIFAALLFGLPLAELEGKMPLAADEVLLYPRRRRYIVSICIGFAGAQIYSCRERIYPFRIYRFRRQFPVGLTQ